MYKIISENGTPMGYTDRVNYIRLSGNSILPCPPVEGRGINYKGEIYNLPGWNEWPDRPTAYPSMVTDGELNAMKENAEQQTTALQLGLVEAYEQSLQAQASAEKQVTDLQLALVELYESII